MWWEYVIVGGAVAGSLLFVLRTAFRSEGGCGGGGCDAGGCGTGAKPTVLQRDVPVLDLGGRDDAEAR